MMIEGADDHAHGHAHEHNIWAVPKTNKGRIFWAVSFPLMLAFTYTIPDCRKEKMKKYYVATFIIAILWLGVLVEFMVEHAIEGFNEVTTIVVMR